MGILIIEDDRDIREMLVETLADEGYEVCGVADGFQALAYLRSSERRPCVILLDLMMPRMDGWQFLQQHGDDPALAAIPVVLLSARSDGPAQVAESSVAAYVSKPVDFGLLLDTVARFCGACA